MTAASDRKGGELAAAEAALLAAVDACQGRLLDWARQLVAIPTVNPYSGDSSAGSETAGQAWIEERFRQLGATVQRVAVPRDVYERGGVIGPAGRNWEGRDNVVAQWVVGDGRGRTVIVNGHMDTVGADGMEFPSFDPVIRDGRLYGRGSSDMKAHLAAGLVAVETLLKAAPSLGLRGRVIFESVVDEECNGIGAGTLACCLAGIGGDVAISLDGAAGHLCNGCNGIATPRLIVRGQAGHSSYGDSVSAIDKAILVKQAIDGFAAEHRKRFPDCQVNLGIFRAGVLAAIVPGEAELQANMAYAVADAAEAQRQTGRWGGAVFRARFEQAMARLGEHDPWLARRPVEVAWVKEVYPYWCDPSDPLLRIIAEAAADAVGEPVPVSPMAAWCDASHLARQLAIPTVGLGAAAPGAAHSPAESVRVEDLFRSARQLALALSRLLSPRDAAAAIC